MVKSNSKQKKGKTYLVRNPSFSKLYATNVKAYFTSYDFRIETMNERMKFEEHAHVVVDSVIILTPQCAKKLHSTLGKLIAGYEKKNKTIEDTELDAIEDAISYEN